MRTAEELRNELRGMDRRSYPAYKALAGTWQFEKYRLTIDHVQGDPFASPSSLHVELSHRQARIPERYYENPYAKTALRDYIVREAGRQFEKCNFKARGSGKSGLMSISRCGQEVLERSACEIDGEGIILRFHVGFPAFGRTIQAKELEKIVFDFLPECIENAMCWRRLDHQAVNRLSGWQRTRKRCGRYLLRSIGSLLLQMVLFCRERVVCQNCRWQEAFRLRHRIQ